MAVIPHDGGYPGLHIEHVDQRSSWAQPKGGAGRYSHRPYGTVPAGSRSETGVQDFWLARVYYNDGISGNLTGVILRDTPLAPEHLQATATRLSLPDTAFAWPGPDGIPIHRSYSPYEELRFCTQALLATAAVQAALQGSSTGSFQYDTRVGRIPVWAEQEGLWWLQATPDPARAFPDTTEVLRRLGLDERMMADPIAVTGVGRRRLYIPLGSTYDLYSVAMARGAVMQTCMDYQLTGVCLFVVVNPARIALRVFTTSLGGAEDAATGGAALGILGYDRLHPLHLEEVITVEQGHVDRPQRGCLFIQRPVSGHEARLGGFVDALMRGTLRGQADSRP